RRPDSENQNLRTKSENQKGREMTKTRWPYAMGSVFLLVLGACGSSKKTSTGGASTTAVSVPAAVGKGEGALNLIAWAGYAESGQTDPKVDWVTPFQTKTGC